MEKIFTSAALAALYKEILAWLIWHDTVPGLVAGRSDSVKAAALELISGHSELFQSAA